MKKKIIALLTAACMVGTLCACGADNSSESTAEDNLFNIEVEKYVTLGDYKGLDINVPQPSVSDSEVEYYMNQQFASLVTAENGITDREVANGDIANIDYEGKKDGVAFDGGSAQGTNLTIGSGQFIEGFEEGLIGVMPGETVDLNLTFPENYKSEDLAGQEVVFTVTVNYIMPEVSDEILAAAGNANYSNTEEFRDYVYNNLYSYAESNYQNQLETSIISAIIENAQYTEELPSALMEKYKSNITMNLATTASYYGMDAETYATTVYGTDLETLVNEYSVESTKQGLAFQAIANAEGITMTEDELDASLSEYATQNGYGTVEEFLGESPKEDFKEYFMFMKVMDFVKENINIIEE